MADRNDYGYGVSGDREREIWGQMLDLALEFMDQNYDVNVPVVQFKTPKELREIIEFPVPEKARGLEGVIEDIRSTVKYSVRTGHCRFFNQLWAGTDKSAVLGEFFTAVLNSSMYTYEVAPVFALMELTLIDWLLGLFGFEKGEGVFAPGGAHCNLLAVIAARNAADANVKQHGIVDNKRYVIITSKQSHYTIKRSAAVMGIGMDGAVCVDCDSEGRMIPEAVEQAILDARAQGKIVCCISATCGTTVYGAYDPISRLADIAEKYGVWLHIDAAWGGHCIVSEKHRHLMSGANRANSITWTATKCFGLPQQCAILLMKTEHTLCSCYAMNEDYLFHEHDEKAFDLGEKTLNCGRRVDAFKLWLSLQVQGQQGFAAICDHAFDQARYLTELVKSKPEAFQMVHEPESLNVCFWFIPPSARGLTGDARLEKMGDVTAKIRRVMQLEGKIMFNYSNMDGLPGHFFRFISCNPFAKPEDLDFALAEVERIGADL